jgi:hypothetical protein
VRLYALYRWIRADSVRTVGTLCGLSTALSGVVGYVLLPVLTGSASTLTGAAAGTVTDPTIHSLLYHATVLAVPPFVVTMAGTIFVRRQGFTGRRVDATLVGGTVVGPLLTVAVAYFLTAMGIGLYFTQRPSAVTFDELFLPILVFLFFALHALVFGIAFVLLAVGVVFVVETPAAVVGVLCGRLGWRLAGGKRRPSRSGASEQSQIENDPD